MWFFKIIESFFKRERGEQGSGLMTVLGVSLVVTIAAGTITSSIVMASNMTNDKLTAQQAEEAAEAGLNKAINQYRIGECVASPPKNDKTDEPIYKYNFYRSNSDEFPTRKDAPGTYAGCPGSSGEGVGSTADRWVLIESTGYNEKETISKAKTAVFKIEPDHNNVIPQAITAGQVELIGTLNLNKASGVIGDSNIYIKDSTYNNVSSFFKCSSLVNINANVKYESKNSFNEYNNTKSLQDCNINGNLSIDAPVDPSVDLSNLGVNGDVCSERTPIPQATAKKVKGSLIKSDDCSTEGLRYGYVPDMEGSIPVNTESCNNWSSFSSQVKQVSGRNNGESNILDLTGCTDTASFAAMTYDSSYKDLVIDGDVTLVFNKYFKFNRTTIESSGGNHNINFVVPSSVSNPEDSAYAYGNTSTFTNVKYKEGTSGIAYTPYNFQTYYATTINGQIYAGRQYIARDQYDSVTTLNYMPVGLPNAEKKIKDIGKAKDLIRVY